MDYTNMNNPRTIRTKTKSTDGFTAVQNGSPNRNSIRERRESRVSNNPYSALQLVPSHLQRTDLIAKMTRGCQAVKVYEEDEESVQSVEEIHEEEINNNNINNNNKNYGKQNNNNNDENEEDEGDDSDNDDSIPGLQERYVEDSSDDDDDDDNDGDNESVAGQECSFKRDRNYYEDDDTLFFLKNRKRAKTEINK
jgi:protein-tyrosine-phosphatase